ncbi:peptidyl-tRNA hydrolase [Plasmodium falciparum Tanzania (2000708)]|uniref:peptidyl-tRNA hydrolase n=1 Tax=Plasmodium falciparum Tanzania (2000708) TaxID=1036725 RepID=A0A024WD68_PLAFA|nr:peptidyl-tRNA hydrolase [Plasmodium falciparum Tanzania (2000708)]
MSSDNKVINNLQYEKYDNIALFVAFLCGLILGLVINYYKSMKKKVIKIKEVCETFDLKYKTDCKMVFCVRTDIKMTKGKICSQCCHACLSVYEKILKRNNKIKDELQQKNSLTYFDSLEEMFEIESKAQKENLITSIIVDAGRTQIEPNTETVIAIEPVPDEIVNKITGDLKLL